MISPRLSLNPDDNLTLARRVMLAGATLYPLWGHLALALIPGAHEAVYERYVVGAAFLVSWILSRTTDWGKAHTSQLLFVCYLLLTGHYFWLVHIHALSPMYVIGAFIAVCSINACLTTLREFRGYAGFVLAAAGVLTLANPQQLSLALITLLGLATQQILVYISLHARVTTLQRLIATQTELARRTEEMERANEELRQADRYKDDFLGIISHELRTPLNAVLGFGSILEDGIAGELNPQQRPYLEKILASADAQLRLVSDLLDMSRIQAGKFSLEQVPAAFPELAREVLATMGPLAEAQQSTLVNEVPEDLPVLMIDPQRIGQVLTNLVGNAIKFSPEGGRVVVRACQEGGAIRCEVIDSGEGISEEHISKLFQPFSQIDSSRTRKSGGTGLGLSIAKALVEAHGGAIGVESAPGGGSTFWFTLPLPESPADAEQGERLERA